MLEIIYVYLYDLKNIFLYVYIYVGYGKKERERERERLKWRERRGRQRRSKRVPAVEPATAGPNARESVSVPKSAELSPNSGRARFVPGASSIIP